MQQSLAKFLDNDERVSPLRMFEILDLILIIGKLLINHILRVLAGVNDELTAPIDYGHLSFIRFCPILVEIIEYLELLLTHMQIL